MGRNSSYRAQSPQLLSLFHLFFVSNSDNQCFSNFQAETTNLSWYALSIQCWDEIWSYLQVTSIYSWSNCLLNIFYMLSIYISYKTILPTGTMTAAKIEVFLHYNLKILFSMSKWTFGAASPLRGFFLVGAWLVGKLSPSIQKGKSCLFIIKPLKYQIIYTRLFQ